MNHIGVFPKWSRTVIEFSGFNKFGESDKSVQFKDPVFHLWEHPGLLHEKWQVKALLMTNIFVIS